MTKLIMKYDSILEIYFSYISIKLAPMAKKYKLLPNDITTTGLLFNLFAILSLYKLEYPLFVVFYIMGQFCDTMDGVYARLYNLETPFGHFYDHIVDSIKIGSLIYTIYIIYYRWIDIFSMGIIYIISILCIIHFSIKQKLYILNGKKVDMGLEYWAYIASFIGGKERLENIAKYTKYFDESSSMLYIIIIVGILHYRLLYS